MRINNVESQLSSLTSMLNALINKKNSAIKVMENMSKAIKSNQKMTSNINIKNVKLESKVKHLEENPTWPSGSYCILKNGECPIGFTRVENGIHALKMWSCTGGFTGKGNFGSSYFGKRNSRA